MDQDGLRMKNEFRTEFIPRMARFCCHKLGRKCIYLALLDDGYEGRGNPKIVRQQQKTKRHWQTQFIMAPIIIIRMCTVYAKIQFNICQCIWPVEVHQSWPQFRQLDNSRWTITWWTITWWTITWNKDVRLCGLSDGKYGGSSGVRQRSAIFAVEVFVWNYIPPAHLSGPRLVSGRCWRTLVRRIYYIPLSVYLENPGLP